MNVHIKNRPNGQSPQPADIAHFMQILSCVSNVQTACWMGAEFLAQMTPEDVQETTVALSHVHPFFLPDIDQAEAEKQQISLGQFAETVLQARLTANRAQTLKILVADGAGHSSTMLGVALREALGLRSANLVSPAYSDYSASLFGANLNSRELDELALQRNGLDCRGYVAQHQMLCTPYAARQMALYGIQPIVITRNFFTSLISMDDALIRARKAQMISGESFFDDGLPACYQDLPLDDRLDLLVDAQAVWHAQFLTSWQRCQASRLVKPLWISFEKDIQGDLSGLAEKIAGFIGDDKVDALEIAASLTEAQATDVTSLDKSLTYRGKLISPSIRERATAIFKRYANDADLTSVIDR